MSSRMLPFFEQLKYLHLAWFSKPAGDRLAYKTVRKHKTTRILELGLGQGRRAQRLIRLAAVVLPQERISYAAVDLFEMRAAESGAGLSIKAAHCQLSELPAKVRLIPGDPYSGLARMANSLGPHDLVIVSADQDRESLAKAWFYVPRVLTPEAIVLLEEPAGENGELALRPIARADIEQWARAAAPRRAA